MTSEKKSLVDDYKSTKKPIFPRHYYESLKEDLNQAKPAGRISDFYRSEVKPILEGRIDGLSPQYEKSILSDILFEYLVIKVVTYLEIQLRYHCDLLIKEYPERAESLLENRDTRKDLGIQILSNYSFANLKEIYHVFSTLLGKDFFQLLRHRSQELRSILGNESDHPYRASPLYKSWDLFEQLFRLRNELVHKNKRISIKSKKDRKNIIATVYDVIYILDYEDQKRPYNENSFTKFNYSF
ncbi:hypothetical protein [Candidatus Nitrosotenuis aquarius]|uniref:hypothetical protein n=1 Tax=Candidatus Nitrosotenuis aquarius TaxID=1846278 RepID=UPI000C1DF4CF|nr:hypothetical protein [Candidatus Nitrosotenuis aquarius]